MPPTGGVVTALARSLKCAPVRILVTTAARRKRKILVLHVRLAVFGQRVMTTAAGYLLMQPGKRVAGGRVIESGRGLPGLKTMAPRAVLIELPAMFVRVARAAGCGESEIGTIQVFDPNDFPQRRRNVLGRVALTAGSFGVHAGEYVAGLPVVEVIVGWLPLDDVELGAKVLGVAAGAFLVPGGILDDVGVEPPLGCQFLLDFRVATGALEFTRAQPEAVTR
jgi:hypothetical protein